MFLLKLLMKALLLPVYLFITFITFMVNFASVMGSVIVGLYFFLMILLLLWMGVHHDWLGVGIGLGFSFIAYLGSVAALAVNGLLQSLSDKVGAVIFS